MEEELTKVLPNARVIRMDVDTTSRKGAHENYCQLSEKEKRIFFSERK